MLFICFQKLVSEHSTPYAMLAQGTLRILWKKTMLPYFSIIVDILCMILHILLLCFWELCMCTCSLSYFTVYLWTLLIEYFIMFYMYWICLMEWNCIVIKNKKNTLAVMILSKHVVPFIYSDHLAETPVSVIAFNSCRGKWPTSGSINLSVENTVAGTLNFCFIFHYLWCHSVCKIFWGSYSESRYAYIQPIMPRRVGK